MRKKPTRLLLTLLSTTFLRQESGSGETWTAWASVNYLMGASGPLARIPALASGARCYVYDGLGSVLAKVDVSGAVQSSRKYDVYGATRSYAGTPLESETGTFPGGYQTIFARKRPRFTL